MSCFTLAHLMGCPEIRKGDQVTVAQFVIYENGFPSLQLWGTTLVKQANPHSFAIEVITDGVISTYWFYKDSLKAYHCNLIVVSVTPKPTLKQKLAKFLLKLLYP